MIRGAKIEDFDEIYRLHEMLVKKLSTLEPDRFLLKDNEKVSFTERFNKYLKESNRKMIVYELDGEIIGFGACKILKSVNFSRFEEHGEITEISVKEEMQNRGIGREIMKELESFLKDNGISEIVFLVESSNHQSLATWEKMNYKKETFVFKKMLK
ncbi:hypothetical protein COU60_04050 [Candidatus Pacearchaeota archaeon CG10_big_fil_rev_8_21_14_0_10_34_76]|nr:MAG: hypothetical protein COU60_04050 [Candidatus Pacearchaeota archaeon CG10_big_fil_rev_8_21_14_0_10_34_76]